MINLHPDAACFGETTFWGRSYEKPGDDNRYNAQTLSRLGDRYSRWGLGPPNDTPGGLASAADGSLKKMIAQRFAEAAKQAEQDASNHLTPREAFSLLCDCVAQCEGKSVIVEKTPHHTMWIDRILEQMPEAKFLVVVRPPFAFMLSYKHQGDRWNEAMRRDFERRYHPLACALVWRRYAEAAQDAAKRFPLQVMTLDFQAFSSERDEVVRQVYAFFELRPIDLPQVKPPTNTSFASDTKPTLKPADLFWLNLIARKEIKAGGYEKQATPWAPWQIFVSIVVLPVWLVRNVLDMRRFVRGSAIKYMWRWFRGR